jgi:cytochrome c
MKRPDKDASPRISVPPAKTRRPVHGRAVFHLSCVVCRAEVTAEFR